MRRKTLFLLFLFAVLLYWGPVAQAQQWSGILAANRRNGLEYGRRRRRHPERFVAELQHLCL